MMYYDAVDASMWSVKQLIPNLSLGADFNLPNSIYCYSIIKLFTVLLLPQPSVREVIQTFQCYCGWWLLGNDWNTSFTMKTAFMWTWFLFFRFFETQGHRQSLVRGTWDFCRKSHVKFPVRACGLDGIKNRELFQYFTDWPLYNASIVYNTAINTPLNLNNSQMLPGTTHKRDWRSFSRKFTKDIHYTLRNRKKSNLLW